MHETFHQESNQHSFPSLFYPTAVPCNRITTKRKMKNENYMSTHTLFQTIVNRDPSKTRFFLVLPSANNDSSSSSVALLPRVENDGLTLPLPSLVALWRNHGTDYLVDSLDRRSLHIHRRPVPRMGPTRESKPRYSADFVRPWLMMMMGCRCVWKHTGSTAQRPSV